MSDGGRPRLSDLAGCEEPIRSLREHLSEHHDHFGGGEPGGGEQTSEAASSTDSDDEPSG